MKALLSDIKARIKDPISNNELSGLLFQLGHENDIQDNIIDIDSLKSFNYDGYLYHEQLSTAKDLIFTR